MKNITLEKSKYYKEFCKKFRAKLKEITDPVALDENNRSYQALSDVVTNIILLEINLDRKPWDEISKRDVVLPSLSELSDDILNRVEDDVLARKLLKKIEQKVSYIDCHYDNYSETIVKDLGLFAALKNYLS
jgi:hypothetical protein